AGTTPIHIGHPLTVKNKNRFFFCALIFHQTAHQKITTGHSSLSGLNKAAMNQNPTRLIRYVLISGLK
ncbi:hypothetical protein, partial [Yersinia intermedia]|uniref:hypothetical protein n=1 Tax=Yersinia intermedia TaxID=631 RepID=UPI002242E763